MQLADPRYSPGMSKPINDDATTTHAHLHLTTSTGSILLAVKTLLRDGRPVFVRGDGAIPSEGEGTTGLGALNGGRRQERLCGRRNRRGVLRGSEPLAHEAIHLQRRLRSATSTRAGLENASTSDSPPGDPSAYCPDGRGGDPSGGGDPAGTGRRRRGRSSSGRPLGGERGGDGIRSWMQVGTIDGGNDDGRCWMWDSGPTATGRPRRLPRRTRRGSVRGGPPAGIVWRRTQGDDDAGDVKYEWREASGKVVQWALFARGGRRHLVLGAGGHH